MQWCKLYTSCCSIAVSRIMRTRVKICGIICPEDGVVAAEAGADAIGLVFYPASPRAVTIGLARAVVDRLPPFVSVVGLFVNAQERAIRDVLAGVRIDLLQFHGDEPPQACGLYGCPYIKALTMRNGMDVRRQAADYSDAAALLLDAYHRDLRGGSGECFDWARFPRDIDKPLILAGGLNPDNVMQAIEVTRPYAVDVSSGVEHDKGIKDPVRIAAFMRNVTGFRCKTRDRDNNGTSE